MSTKIESWEWASRDHGYAEWKRWVVRLDWNFPTEFEDLTARSVTTGRVTWDYSIMVCDTRWLKVFAICVYVKLSWWRKFPQREDQISCSPFSGEVEVELGRLKKCYLSQSSPNIPLRVTNHSFSFCSFLTAHNISSRRTIAHISRQHATPTETGRQLQSKASWALI